MIWLASDDGKLLTDLPEWRTVTGMTVEELLGDGWLDAIHPDDRGHVAQAWGTAVATGEVYEAAYRIVGRDGEPRWMDVRGVPVDAPGGVREWIGTCHDDTERRALQDRLADERATLERVLDQSLAAVAVLWGAEHRFRFYNERFLDLVPEGRVVPGATVRETLPEASDVLPLLDRAYRGETIRLHDHPVPFEDDRSFRGSRYYDVIYAPVWRDGSPAGVTVVAQETTEQVRERRSLEARLRHERILAERFQRALLPGHAAEIRGVDLAVRYLPATVDVGVGGDWYDVVELADDRVLLVVGDVCGRGLQAATTMAQVRSAVRAYAVEESRPARLLRRLRAFTRSLRTDLVTVGLCLVDVRRGTVRYASAGHPPPVICRPDRPPAFLDVLGASMLGLDEPDEREIATGLSAGGAIVMYTDGLIEEPGRHLGETMEELRDAADCHDADAAHMCDRVLSARIGGGAARDDTALLVCRWTPEAAPPRGQREAVSATLPSQPLRPGRSDVGRAA